MPPTRQQRPATITRGIWVSVLAPNPLHKRINRGGHRPASELTERSPLADRWGDQVTNRAEQHLGRFREPATHPRNRSRPSTLHRIPRPRIPRLLTTTTHRRQTVRSTNV